MQIDWFTFGAQILNFLILVWLLRRFLYGPITSAMAEREQRIADRFEEARQEREKAEEEAATYRQKQEALEATRQEKIAAAEEEARKRRRALVEEARAEIDRMEEQWTETLRRERETFLTDLARRASRETLRLARRTLRDLADADLEKQVVNTFIDRLRALDDDRRRTLADAVRSEKEDVTIHTAFPLDDEPRQHLVDAFRTVTDTEVSPSFEPSEDVGLGIELRAGGHKVAWSLDSYLGELEDRIRTRLDAAIATEADQETDPAPPSPVPSDNTGAQ